MTTIDHKKKICIIGAGMGGLLSAMYLARRGHEITIYELRPDLRVKMVDRGRSINMTLALRGLKALAGIGALDTIIPLTLPLRGRLVHRSDGVEKFYPYGKTKDQVIYSINRAQLNAALINLTERIPNVQILFNHRCVKLQKNAEVTIHNEISETEFTRAYDVIIGADGTYSQVRQEMQRGERGNFQIEYNEYGYKELTIPQGPNSTHQLDNSMLHVWPRGGHMLLAIPNLVGSFTCTLTMAFEGDLSFKSLRTKEDVVEFFQSNFADAAALMSNFAEEFAQNSPAKLVTTRVSPWYYKDRIVLLGDSCHTVLPFYGQGMNATFEDCQILDQCMARYPENLELAFREYQDLRQKNTDTLADLSKQNLIELRDSVLSPTVAARKKIDFVMNRVFPRKWIPIYTMISHSTMPYAEAVARRRRQDRILKYLGFDLVMGLYSAAQALPHLLMSRPTTLPSKLNPMLTTETMYRSALLRDIKRKSD